MHAPSTRYSMPVLATGRRRRSTGTSRSGGPATCRRVAARARLHLAGCSASATSRSRPGAASSAAWTTTTPTAPRCTSRSRDQRRTARHARWPTDAIAFLDAHEQQFFLYCTSTIRTSATSWPHRGPESRPHPDLYDGEIRFTDLHAGCASRAPARAGHRRRDDGRTRRRRAASTASPSTADPTRQPKCRTSSTCRACWRSADHSGRPSTWRRRIEPGAATPEPVTGACAPAGAPGCKRGRAAPGLQEVLSERGKKRAMVSATHHSPGTDPRQHHGA